MSFRAKVFGSPTTVSALLMTSTGVDHILPAFRGGDNSIENGIYASYFYNMKKRGNLNDKRVYISFGAADQSFFYFYNLDRKKKTYQLFAMMDDQ